MSKIIKSIIIFLISLVVSVSAITVAFATDTDNSNQDNASSNAPSNSLSNIENILKTLQAQKTQAADQANQQQLSPQQANPQQLGQYYDQQNQLLTKIKQQNDQARWQSIVLSAIYLITIVYLWIFMWYGISALKAWVRRR